MFGGPRVGGEKYAAEEGVAFFKKCPFCEKGGNFLTLFI